jgi:hypothetical protein
LSTRYTQRAKEKGTKRDTNSPKIDTNSPKRAQQKNQKQSCKNKAAEKPPQQPATRRNKYKTEGKKQQRSR